MKYKLYTLFIAIIITGGIMGVKLHLYYTPAHKLPPYQTIQHHDDTIRIAYIGDSWAFGHLHHQCQIQELLETKLHRPVTVCSYGIGGLTSKDIFNGLFESENLRLFMEKGYDYCYLSAGINDTYKKMSSSYYQKSMDCIIQFLLANHIHPIIQEIPDYNIQRAFERQTTQKKLIRRISMFVNRTNLNCKQQFRDALDELIQEKGYYNKVSIVRYKSWNSNYEDDLKELYINDQMHLSEKGYSVLDSAIIKEILKHEKIQSNKSCKNESFILKYKH